MGGTVLLSMQSCAQMCVNLPEVRSADTLSDDKRALIKDDSEYSFCDSDTECVSTCFESRLDFDSEPESDDQSFGSPPEVTNKSRVMSRKEKKALDKELSWREIVDRGEDFMDAFVKAVHKEADAWADWSPVFPISESEIQKTTLRLESAF